MKEHVCMSSFRLEQKKPKRAAKVFESYVKLYDELKKPRQAVERRDKRWRLSELYFAHQNWGSALAALTTFLAEYPDDPTRFEARFLMARCLLELGDNEAAKRQFNLVSKEDSKGFYGRLARSELELLKWRVTSLNPTLKASNL